VTPSVDQFGAPIYWIGGEVLPIEQNNTDVTAVADGYISVTPLSIDLTDYVLLDRLAQAGLLGGLLP